MGDRYRVLSHTADTAIEADGFSLSDLIENLAYGMFDLTFDLEEAPSLDTVEIEVEGDTIADLVVNLLADLLAEADTRDMVLVSFSARADEDGLAARVLAAGSPADGVDLRGPPIKAVTYHDLEISHGDDGWYGRVVFDV